MDVFIRVADRSESSLEEARKILRNLVLMGDSPHYLLAELWVLRVESDWIKVTYSNGDSPRIKQSTITEVLTLEDFIAKAKEYKLEQLLETL